MRISDWSSDVCSSDLQELAGTLAAADRDRHLAPPRQIIAGDAGFIADDVVERAFGHHLAAMHARARPHVDDIVGGADRVLVMLHDKHRVAQVAKPLQRFQQPVRSEEHTSELQSLMRTSYAVFCLTKKK